MAPARKTIRGHWSRIPKMAALFAAGTLVAASAVALSTTAAAAAATSGWSVQQTQCASANAADGAMAVTVTADPAWSQAVQLSMVVTGHQPQYDFTLASGQTITHSVSGLAAGDYPVEIFYGNSGGAWFAPDGTVTGGEAAATVTAHIATCTSTPPTISTSVQSVTAGAPLVISVTGAHAGELLNFELHSTVIQLGAATADQSGNASLTATIPADVPPGTHTVTVTGEWTNLEQSLEVTAILGPTPTPTDTSSLAPSPAPTDGHTIPSKVQTDGDSAPLLWLTASVLMMALTTAGGAGLAWRRVRRG